MTTPSKHAATSSAQLPKEKQTVLGLYVTAKEAYEKWKADPERVMVLTGRTGAPSAAFCAGSGRSIEGISSNEDFNTGCFRAFGSMFPGAWEP
jgi:hypothetical protein